MAEYIERESLLREIERRKALMVGDKLVSVDAMKSFIKNRPAADVAEVVRCENCEFSRELTKTEKRIWLDECRACENPEASQDGYMIVFPEHFCSYGRRMEGGNDNVSD